MIEQHKQAIAELECFYGGNVLNGGILEATWISEMQKLSIQELQVAIARCFKKHPRKYNYFPSPDEILEFARGSVPAENSQAYQKGDLTKPPLPACEGISPEEAEATKREILISRLFLASMKSLNEQEKDNFFPRMRKFSTHDLEQMVLTANSPVIIKQKLSAYSTALNMFESLAIQASNSMNKL